MFDHPNPIVTAREQLGLSQRDVADYLNTSQQFIQRHEIGQSATLPIRLGDFYDGQITASDRLGILGDLIAASVAVRPGTSPTTRTLADYIPRVYFPGEKVWRDDSRTFARMYRLWVLLSRKSLPDLSGLSRSVRFDPQVRGRNQSEAQRFFESARIQLGVAAELDSHQQRYEVATALRIHPFVLTRFLDHPEKATDLPPTIQIALGETKK